MLFFPRGLTSRAQVLLRYVIGQVRLIFIQRKPKPMASIRLVRILPDTRLFGYLRPHIKHVSGFTNNRRPHILSRRRITQVDPTEGTVHQRCTKMERHASGSILKIKELIEPIKIDQKLVESIKIERFNRFLLNIF